MKKIVLIAAVAFTVFSCSKVGKNEFLITGNAKGIEDGKMVVLQNQDPLTGIFTAVDSVKIKGGKFELKGKTTEPEFKVLQVGKKENKVGFILENGEINFKVDKDSINNTVVSGTYNNDEFTSFKKESVKSMKDMQKKLADFEKNNMKAMTDARTKGDNASIEKLMKDYQEIQKLGTEFYTKYAETHSKSFLSALVVEGMLNNPQNPETARAKKIYESLDAVLKNTKIGKSIKTKLDKPVAPPAPPMPAMTAPAPTAQ